MILLVFNHCFKMFYDGVFFVTLSHLDIPWGEWSPCDRSCKTESEPGIRGPGTTFFCLQCQTVSLAPGPKQNHREEAEVTKIKWHEKNETNVYLWFICSWTSAMCQESVSAQLWWFTRWFPEGFVHITTSLLVRTPHWGSRKWTGEGVPHEQDVLSSAQIISTDFHIESPQYLHNSSQFFTGRSVKDSNISPGDC